jgi:putative molybdopterin biosynthesis protein
VTSPAADDTALVTEHAGASRRAAIPDLGWMGVLDAATRLGVTNRTVYRFINDGDLVAYKIGRVIRIQQADLDAFIESTRIQPGTLDHLVPGGYGTDDHASDDDGPDGDGDLPSTA